LNYGRGRAEQFRLHPSLRSAPNFVPPLFCFYLVALPFLPAEFRWAAVAYLAAVLVQGMAVLGWRKWYWLPRIMGLIFVSHVVYGLGFWRGCVTRPKPPPPAVLAAVKIEKIQ
jgi:energy-coupling factor transporter transmembrane protein EcfT